MGKNRKNTYWLILPALILAAGLLARAAAPTQSRYITVAGWQMALSQLDTNLHCDLLTQDGQRILLQDLSVDDTRQIPLTLTSAGNVTAATLSVESQYLTAELSWDQGGVYEETVTETLTISATEEAKKSITTPTEASARLTLTWDGGSLQGEILVLLIPQETIPENTGVTEETTDDPSGGTTENPDEITDSSAEENAEDVPENEENSEENTQTKEENTAVVTNEGNPAEEDTSGEETTEEDATGEDATGENTTGENTTEEETTEEDTTEENTSEEDTPTPDEPVPMEVGTWLTGMTNFAADGVLPLLVEVPEGCEEIRMELAVGEDPAGQFPAGTRYSADEGESYTLLYDPHAITLTPEEGVQKAAVLLDLSAVAPDKETLMTIKASAVKEGQIFAVSSIPAQAILEIPSVGLGPKPSMLTAERSIQFIMPVYGDSHTVNVVSLNDEQTEGLPSLTLQDGQLTISSDGGAAKPGTYQAVLTWSWRDLEIARQELVFYVNYTPYVQTEQEVAQSTQAADVA